MDERGPRLKDFKRNQALIRGKVLKRSFSGDTEAADEPNSGSSFGASWAPSSKVAKTKAVPQSEFIERRKRRALEKELRRQGINPEAYFAEQEEQEEHDLGLGFQMDEPKSKHHLVHSIAQKGSAASTPHDHQFDWTTNNTHTNPNSSSSQSKVRSSSFASGNQPASSPAIRPKTRAKTPPVMSIFEAPQGSPTIDQELDNALDDIFAFIGDDDDDKAKGRSKSSTNLTKRRSGSPITPDQPQTKQPPSQPTLPFPELPAGWSYGSSKKLRNGKFYYFFLDDKAKSHWEHPVSWQRYSLSVDSPLLSNQQKAELGRLDKEKKTQEEAKIQKAKEEEIAAKFDFGNAAMLGAPLIAKPMATSGLVPGMMPGIMPGMMFPVSMPGPPMGMPGPPMGMPGPPMGMPAPPRGIPGPPMGMPGPPMGMLGPPMGMPPQAGCRNGQAQGQWGGYNNAWR